MFDYIGGTFSHNGVIDYPRFSVSEMHLGNFLDSTKFLQLESSFKTEICSKKQILISDQRS